MHELSKRSCFLHEVKLKISNVFSTYCRVNWRQQAKQIEHSCGGGEIGCLGYFDKFQFKL